jgi:hypothetical protein
MCVCVHCSVSVSLDQPTSAHPMSHCQLYLLLPSMPETRQPEPRPVIGHWRCRPASSAKEGGEALPPGHKRWDERRETSPDGGGRSGPSAGPRTEEQGWMT